MAAGGTVRVDSYYDNDDGDNKEDDGSGRRKSDNVTAVAATQRRRRRRRRQRQKRRMRQKRQRRWRKLTMTMTTAVVARVMAAGAVNNDLIHVFRIALTNISNIVDGATSEWIAFSTDLHNPDSSLENLNLHDDSMSYTVIGALIIALTNNSRLKKLKLGWNPHITAAGGWVAFLTILQTPNSALEVLHLQQNSINNLVQISFANELANNSIGVDPGIGFSDCYFR